MLQNLKQASTYNFVQDSTNIIFVNCDRTRNLCKDYNISRIPSIKVFLMQNNILILLLLRKEYTSPKAPENSKTLPTNEFLLKSVNGQKQIDSIVFKFTPLLMQFSSHKEIFGKYIWNLNFSGISLLFGDK